MITLIILFCSLAIISGVYMAVFGLFSGIHYLIMGELPPSNPPVYTLYHIIYLVLMLLGTLIDVRVFSKLLSYRKVTELVNRGDSEMNAVHNSDFVMRNRKLGRVVVLYVGFVSLVAIVSVPLMSDGVLAEGTFFKVMMVLGGGCIALIIPLFIHRKETK